MIRYEDLPDVPDLSTSTLLDRFVNVFFRNAGARTPEGGALAIGYIRLTDKAVREYQSARRELRDGSGRIHRVVRASDHLENSIGAVCRAVRFAEALTRAREDVEKPPRSIFSSSAKRRLTDIRDAIEHQDNDIVRGKAPIGTPTAPVVEDGHLRVGGTRILVQEYVTWLGGLVEFAQALSDYRPSPAGAQSENEARFLGETC